MCRGVGRDAASIGPSAIVERLARVAARECDAARHLVHRGLRLDLGHVPRPRRRAPAVRRSTSDPRRPRISARRSLADGCVSAWAASVDLGQDPVPVADPEASLRRVAEQVRPPTDTQVAHELDALASDAVREPWVLAGRNVAEVDARAELRIDEAVGRARLHRTDQGHDRFAQPTEVGEGRPAGDQELDRLARSGRGARRSAGCHRSSWSASASRPSSR